MAALLEDPEQRPDEPLLRDPPPPPGYVDPIAESDVLQGHFASEDGPTMAEANRQVRRDIPGAGAV